MALGGKTRGGSRGRGKLQRQSAPPSTSSQTAVKFQPSSKPNHIPVFNHRRTEKQNKTPAAASLAPSSSQGRRRGAAALCGTSVCRSALLEQAEGRMVGRGATEGPVSITPPLSLHLPVALSCFRHPPALASPAPPRPIPPRALFSLSPARAPLAPPRLTFRVHRPGGQRAGERRRRRAREPRERERWLRRS